MLGHEPKILGLLPVLGLCSCVVSGEGEVSISPGSALSPVSSEQAPSWIELESPHQPLTTVEAATLSARSALAAHDFRAARDSLIVAVAYEPKLAELRFDQVDALIGLGQFDQARELLSSIPSMVSASTSELDQTIDARRMLIRERQHALGVTPCDASVDEQRRPLARHDDFLSAWNELGASLPSSDEIPIPTSEDDARDALCDDGCYDYEPRIVRLEGERSASVGLIIPHADGSVSVLPELIHPVWTSCSDDSELSVERYGDLLRVRAFTDAREEFDPSDWELDSAVALGPTTAVSSGYYAGSASSGYASSGYASSGYASSGYASSGYNYSYGCSGYDYGYDYDPYYCAPTQSVERDVFIDLASGEVVLDIVRSGTPSSRLGTVELQGRQVRVDACGTQDTLALSWTQA